MKKGYFIISLDFELMWGVRDTQTKKTYGKNILGVKSAIEKMLISFINYEIEATFAIVGFLFHKNKKELISNYPDLQPNYRNNNLSPYPHIDKEVDEIESGDPYFFGKSIIHNLKKYTNHEIATHTYCHYYCLEEGQNKSEFKADLNKAIDVASNSAILFKSIVFPRNQTNPDYLEICKTSGINSFRGNEKGFIYSSKSKQEEHLFIRILRFVDSYLNLTGFHCYGVKEIAKTCPYNIASSRFLRPYSKKLFFLEKLKLKRIKNAMTHAAKHNLVYHLWWHPHNFGVNLEKNICMLNEILSHYKYLSQVYNFESITMNNLAEKLKNLQ
jgi:hypothetical protein